MKFEFEIDGDGVWIAHRPGLLRRVQRPDDWKKSDDRELSRAFGHIRPFLDADAEDEKRAAIKDDQLFLSHALAASLEERSARALGLPPATPYGLRLETEDQVMSEGFRVRARFIRGGGVPVGGKIRGAFHIKSGIHHRIAEPAFTLKKLAEPLGEALEEPERLAAYSALHQHLIAHVDSNIDADDYIDSVTVYHASAFSLSLGVRDDTFEFDPVLFGREVAHAAEGGEVVDEEDSTLLPPNFQALFARDRFRRYEAARNSYPLERGSFVVIDPSLRPAMSVVRRAASADTATRRTFVANPTGFIKDALSEDSDSVDAIDHLFIETEQFSERVTGIDIWRQPVLPWVKPTPNSWLPESFGIQIGENKKLELESDQLNDLSRALDRADQAGEPVVICNGVEVPVTPQARAAVEDLIELENQRQLALDNSDANAESAAPPPILTEKRFLTVSDNFETVEFLQKPDAATTPPRPPAAPPGTVRATLKDYQAEGFRWLASARQHGFPGVLLADDMGLGKTLQTLAFLAWNRSQADGPVLVVAPTGLLNNWKAEIEKHLDLGALGPIVDAYGSSLRELKVHPSASTETKTGQTILNVQKWRDAGVVLTTYETMRDYHFSLARIRFSAAVFDEIQKLKNPSSQVSRAARSLNTDFKIGMSGTPVENRLQDLWSIMDVLWPGLLGSSRDFESAYPSNNTERLEALHTRIFSSDSGAPPIGLRRLKTDKLDGLPEKSEQSDPAEMPDSQADAYRAVVMRAHAMKASATPGDGMLKVLHQLRSISLHPDPPETGYGDMNAYVQRSARLRQAAEILDGIHDAGEKALIFLESLDMQAFMADYIQKRYRLPTPPARIHGGVPGAKRQAIVDAFQNALPGFDVLILSPKAGGVGLTITAANHVIHLSRWWNPAVEDQSTDRVYRLGQQKAVRVYYPLAVHPSPHIREHSFDLKLDALLRSKRALAGRMLLPPENRDADAAGLFDGISVDFGETDDVPAAASGMATPAVHVESQSPQTPPPTPAGDSLDQTSSQSTTRRFKYAEGVLPDLDAIFEGIDRLNVSELVLIDPYSFWRRDGQKALAEIVVYLCKQTGGIKKVRHETRSIGGVDGADFPDEGRARHHFSSLIAPKLNHTAITMPKIAYRERRRSHDRDFHDRYIQLHYETDGEPWMQEYLVSRGLDAFSVASYSTEVIRFAAESKAASAVA